MNLLLVISLAIGLAQCQSSADSLDAAYRDGKEYVYKYESQVLTGLPKGSKIYSGIKVKATVRFQVPSVSRVKMQLDDARIFKVNDQIDTVDPTRAMLPTELFKEIRDPDVDKIKTELFKPCTFSYIHGHVDDLVTENDDPNWSVNIKRGILSFLELNFNERQSLQSLDNPVSVERADLLPKFYRVVEPSVVGECETSYWVKPDITPDGQPLMNIMKVRNYERCLDTVSYFFDMFNGRDCDFCEPNTRFHPLSSQSSAKYNIVGSPSQYLIMDAFAESQFNFAPYSEKGGRITTYTNQTFTLIDSRPMTSRIQSPNSPQKHEKPITADNPAKRKSDKSSVSEKQEEMKQMEISENYKMAVMALTALEKFTRDKVETEIGDVMVELRRLLRTLDKPRLEKLLTKFNTDSMKHAKKGLWDLLPVIGTVEGVEVIIDKLMEDETVIDWPPSVFINLALMPRPDIPTIQKILDFVDKMTFKNPVHKRTALLSLGSLGYKMMKMNETEGKETQMQQQLIQELKEKSNVKQVRRDLDKKLQKKNEEHRQRMATYNELRRKIVDSVLRHLKSSNPDDILLAIKTIGNLGYIELWPEVKAIIMNKEVPTIRRMQAIFCTRRMYHYIPNKVRRDLLPVYLDRKEKEEIRMAAYLTFMNTMPPKPDLEIIARSVLDEPSYNVGALVWSNLMSLSNRTTTCTCNCIQSLARNTTLALRYAKRFNWGLQYSNYMLLSSYARDLQAGHLYQHAMLFTANERLPRGVAMQYTAAFLGQQADMLEVGINAKGLDSYLDELSKETGSTSLPDVISGLLKPRKPRSTTQSEQEMQDIKRKLKIEPRVPDHMEGHVYFKLFGQELIYVPINQPERQAQESSSQSSSSQQDASSRFASAASSLFNMMKMMRSFVYPLRHETIITETGLPLMLRLDLVGALKIDTDFRQEQRRSMQKSQNPKDMVLDIKPSGLFHLHCKMGVDLQYFQTGAVIKAGLYLNSPLHLSFNINPDKSKMIIRLEEETEMKPMRFESTPMTFIWHFPPEANRYPIYPDTKEILTVDGVELQPVNYEYGKDWLGRIFSITGHRPVPRLDDVPLFPMNGKYLLSTGYKPLNPTGLELQIQHVSDSKEPVTAVHSSQHSSQWWPFTGWFSSSDQHQTSQEQVTFKEQKTSQESSEESGNPSSSSDNLKENDLTIEHLKKKFEKFTKTLKSGARCGFIARLAEPGPNPVHYMQISTFYQRDKPGIEHLYCVELRRAPIPRIENKPWKLVTDIRVMHPNYVVEPSDLFSDQYQQQVQQQIKMSVHHDRKQSNNLVDLDKLTLTQAIKKVLKLTQPSSESQSIKDIVNHLMQQSQDPSKQDLKEIIQKQRQLKKEVKDCERKPSDMKIRNHISKNYQELAEKSELVLRKLQNKLQKTPMGHQEPEDSAMIQSVIVDFQSTMKHMSKILEKIRLILPVHEQVFFQQKLQNLKDLAKSVRQSQERHSEAKQSQEEAKSRMEVQPQQRDVYMSLLDLERLILSTQKSEQYPQDFGFVKPQLEKIVLRSKAAKDKLDQVLIREGKLDKMLRVKVVEIILKHKLMVQDLESELSKRHTSDHRYDETRKDMEVQKDKFKKLAKQLSRRVIAAVNAEKELNLSTSATSADQSRLKMLQVSRVKQIQVLEQLQQLTSKSIQEQQSHQEQQPIQSSQPQDIQQSVETIQEVQDSLRTIVHQKESEFTQENYVSPILIKTLKVLSEQAVIVEEVKQALKQSKIQNAESKDSFDLTPDQEQRSQYSSYRRMQSQAIPKSFSPEELQRKIKSMEREAIILLKKINSLLSKQKTQEKDPRSWNMINSVPPSESSQSARTLLEKLHKVQVSQLQQKDKLQGIKESLPIDQPSQDKGQLFQQLSQIYQILHEMSQLQKSQEEIQDKLKAKLSQPHNSHKLQPVCSQLKDSLQQQKEKAFEMESKVRRFQSDSSSQLLLQKAQQLRDQVQRLCQEQSSLEQRLKDQLKASAQAHFHSQSSEESRENPDEIQGTVTINYGCEGSTMRKIFVKIFGKKSIEQLLWEQMQSRLGEQDKMVQDYLEEKQQKNDKLAPSYHKLKEELNKYFHWKILCAYEKENVAVWTRSFFWMVHEYMKYRFYHKMSLKMPDDTNIPNNFEVVSEFRRDMRSMDMDLRTPYETSLFRNIHVPHMCGIFASFNRNTKDYYTHALKGMTQDKLPATCEISSLRIKTLDHLRYEVPPMSLNCKKVLSMDCSEDSKYLVTSQPSKTDLSLKDITVLTKNQKIEISQQVSGPRVKVNNQEIDLRSPVKIRNEDGTEVSMEKLDKKVTVSIPKLSLHMSTDGKTTSVQVEQYYFSKACGLCGNLDSNPSNDLEGPNRVKYPDGPTMSAAYLVPDQQCDAEEIQKRMGVPDIRKHAEMTPPVQQTKVIEKYQGSVRKTCFSTQPVRRCPEKSSSEGLTSRLVSYHCLDSSSPSTQRLVQRSHSHILDELRYKTVDVNVYESEPKACIQQ